MITATERPSVILNERRNEVIHLANNFGIPKVEIFGSVARGEDNLNSDIDFLVTPNPRNVFSMYRFAKSVRELLGVQVNVLSKSTQESHAKSAIFINAMKDAIAL